MSKKPGKGSAPLRVTLTSSEGESFEVSEQVARRSGVINTVLRDIGADKPIPLLNVNTTVLGKIIDYCEHHQSDPTPPPDGEWNSAIGEHGRHRNISITEWDREYINCEQEVLFEIIQAASYLDIKALLDLGCKTVANMMTGKSVEEIRELFHIENDFTPEEEMAMAVERSEIEMFYDMMGRQLEAPEPIQGTGKAPRKRIPFPQI